ncbi:MAG: isoprenyl transferase [Rhodothalassiaceae bacterium]
MIPAKQETLTLPPRHIAIIMDGNGRWAKRRHLPRALGHRQGAEAVRRTVRACLETGVEVLTLYAFSSENWKRPPDEIEDLMGLLRHYIQHEVDELDRNGVRVRFIGLRTRLSPDIIALIDTAERRTLGNSRMQLVIALNYGSQSEIVDAVRSIAKAARDGLLDPATITEDTIARHLFTADLPDPDLLIRTSGEKRLSNFLLWQAAYAELVFLDVMWPDFAESDLSSAIEEFSRRERRYGARS